MKTYRYEVLIPTFITVTAENEDEARKRLLTEKRFAPLDSDGNPIEIIDGDIRSIEEVWE